MTESDTGQDKMDRALGLDPEHPPVPEPAPTARQIAADRALQRRRRWRHARRRLDTVFHRR